MFHPAWPGSVAINTIVLDLTQKSGCGHKARSVVRHICLCSTSATAVCRGKYLTWTAYCIVWQEEKADSSLDRAIEEPGTSCHHVGHRTLANALCWLHHLMHVDAMAFSCSGYGMQGSAK